MAKEKKPKKVKEKKIKSKNLKGKGEVAEELEGEDQAKGKGKGKGKLKLLLILLSAVLILAAVAIVVMVFVLQFDINFLPFFGSGGEDRTPEESPEPEPIYYELPETFEIGAENVPALVPVEAANVQALKDVRVSYTYIDLTDAGAEAEAYAKLLRGSGFFVVNEEFVRSEAPDYGASDGEVLLAKDMPKAETPAPAEGEAQPAQPEEQMDMVVTMRLTWSPGECVVEGNQAEGKVTSPPKDTTAPGGGSGSMSMQEAVDYLYGLSPADLGLAGESMDSYRIYAKDGSAIVDGRYCMRLEIYDRSGGANEFGGVYLISSDGGHLYLLDEKTNTVSEMKMP